MKLKLISFTPAGDALGRKLAWALEGSWLPGHGENKADLDEWVQQGFDSADALLFVGAVGIAVRAIAPYIRSKATDPAVVVLDDQGRFAVSLLSGHLGGANDLARRVAEIAGAQPVVTTATDGAGVFAADSWSARMGCRVADPACIKNVSARLLQRKEVGFWSEFAVSGSWPRGIEPCARTRADLLLTVTARCPDDKPGALRLIPPLLVLGVGCKRDTPAATLNAAFDRLMEESHLDPAAVGVVCSIDLKAEEPGLLEFCRAHGFPLQTFSAGRLAAASGAFTASEFVRDITGVDNVCERGAVAGAGGRYQSLIIPKTAGNGVTMALAQKPFAPDWSV